MVPEFVPLFIPSPMFIFSGGCLKTCVSLVHSNYYINKGQHVQKYTFYSFGIISSDKTCKFCTN